jgi:CMP-N-acetylneuraminic acid synthetase
MDIKDLKLVSLIPARGGSERIPYKAIKLMAGKPMLVWSIEACLKSKYISRTFVSTEDSEIKKISYEAGAEIIDRPFKYSTDNGYELLGAFQHFKETIWEMGIKPDYLAFLYPTSPLRTSKQIDESYETMLYRNCERVYSAYKVDTGAYEELYTLDKGGKAKRVRELTQEEIHLRNLGLEWQEARYRHTNDVIIMRFREAIPFTDTNYANMTLYIINQNEVVDVNSQYDFDLAEWILERRKNGIL